MTGWGAAREGDSAVDDVLQEVSPSTKSTAAETVSPILMLPATGITRVSGYF